MGIMIAGVVVLGIFVGNTIKNSSDAAQNMYQKMAVEISQDKFAEKSQEEAIPKLKEEKEDSFSEEINVIEENEVKEEQIVSPINQETFAFKEKTYQIIEVDGGNQSGVRESNVAVDIGFGERIYWGLTNEFGQLVYVIADHIILQDDYLEPVNSAGRYYDDEAFVLGTEDANLDQGHVIADSLGGVSNAYNITPQDSTVNRDGDQAYMEKGIQDAGGCTDFVAFITYPNELTQTPSYYYIEYMLLGTLIIDEFPNGNPEKVIETPTQEPDEQPIIDEQAEVFRIDTNKNGQVSIAEAKAAGYSMPVLSSEWLYKYMTDGDGDGMVGE